MAFTVEFRRKTEELFTEVLPELFEMYTTPGNLDYLEPDSWNKLSLDDRNQITATLNRIVPF
jgi:hypothetical protein